MDVPNRNKKLRLPDAPLLQVVVCIFVHKGRQLRLEPREKRDSMFTEGQVGTILEAPAVHSDCRKQPDPRNSAKSKCGDLALSAALL